VEVKYNIQLSHLNTLRLFSQAEAMLCFTEQAQLQKIVEIASQFERIQVLAGGSNVVLKKHVPGLTIFMRSKGIHFTGENAQHYLVTVEAGENWHHFVQYCLKQGWYGLENLALIPGTVGAAPMQNIGAYGVEVQQFIRWVEVFDWQGKEIYRLTAKECQFGYRDSIFKHEFPARWFVLRVGFAFPKQWVPVLDYPDLQQAPELAHEVSPWAIFTAVCRIREKKLPNPKYLPNAGSFFKNPVVSLQQAWELKKQWANLRLFKQNGQAKLAAGWLIEQAGWKGRRLGPLGMHKNQALVLVNHAADQACYNDIQQLKQKVQQAVYKQFKVHLEQEPVDI